MRAQNANAELLELQRVMPFHKQKAQAPTEASGLSFAGGGASQLQVVGAEVSTRSHANVVLVDAGSSVRSVQVQLMPLNIEDFTLLGSESFTVGSMPPVAGIFGAVRRDWNSSPEITRNLAAQAAAARRHLVEIPRPADAAPDYDWL